MRVVILAGGRGTRLGSPVPKPLVEIGGRPLLWHVMQQYAAQGHDDFIIAGGYAVDLVRAAVEKADLPWRARVVDTGEDTGTAGRIRRLLPQLSGGLFLATYADGLSDVSITESLRVHARARSFATVTAVPMPPRFGELELAGDLVTRFAEKRCRDDRWINGGYAVLTPDAFAHLSPEEDHRSLETAVFEHLSTRGLLGAYRHRGFWRCVDTPDDLASARELWAQGDAPWLAAAAAPAAGGVSCAS